MKGEDMPEDEVNVAKAHSPEAKKPRVRRIVETSEVSAPEPVVREAGRESVVNLRTYCVTRKFSRAIQSRLDIYLMSIGDKVLDKTEQEWDEIFKKAMNRITL
jgi:hypothetical protein